MSDADKFRPFSNGNEYFSWRANNCDECRFDYDPEEDVAACPMEKAMANATITDGTIPGHLARAVGVVDEPCRRLADRCAKFIGRDDDSWDGKPPYVPDCPGQTLLFDPADAVMPEKAEVRP